MRVERPNGPPRRDSVRALVAPGQRVCFVVDDPERVPSIGTIYGVYGTYKALPVVLIGGMPV
jgi:hypothetical protein